MSILETMQRFHTSLTKYKFTVNSGAAIQFSGGPEANWPLTGVDANFTPHAFRQAIKLANMSQTASTFIGPASTVSTTDYDYMIPPGGELPLPWDRAVRGWMISDADGGSMTMQELQ